MPVGAVSYMDINGYSYKRDVLFCYDLELPDGFTPINKGECIQIQLPSKVNCDLSSHVIFCYLALFFYIVCILSVFLNCTLGILILLYNALLYMSVKRIPKFYSTPFFGTNEKVFVKSPKPVTILVTHNGVLIQIWQMERWKASS